jgi:hypothetical protein
MWIEYTGANCPVPAGTIVDAHLQHSYGGMTIWRSVRADKVWGKRLWGVLILAYRVHA